MVFGCVPPMVRCEWWPCLSNMVIGCVRIMVRYKCWVILSDMVSICVPTMVIYNYWRRWRPTWRLGLEPTWKRASSVELPMTSIIERYHHLLEIVGAVMMMMIHPDDDPASWRSNFDDVPETNTCVDELCQENTFLVKRECWCICNFGMYSLVYLIL